MGQPPAGPANEAISQRATRLLAPSDGPTDAEGANRREGKQENKQPKTVPEAGWLSWVFSRSGTSSSRASAAQALLRPACLADSLIAWQGSRSWAWGCVSISRRSLAGLPHRMSVCELSASQGVEGRRRRRWRAHRPSRLGLPYFPRLLLGKPRGLPHRPQGKSRPPSFLRPHQPHTHTPLQPLRLFPGSLVGRAGVGPQRVSGSGPKPLWRQQRRPGAPPSPGSPATPSAQVPHSSLPPEP